MPFVTIQIAEGHSVLNQKDNKLKKLGKNQ
jgi:phenylpyruvate tautomerase PptA (4-oxalocrotonate tautomerase family)